MLRRSLLILWYACTALVVLAAFGLSIGRLALPLLQSRSDDIKVYVEQVVGQGVVIGRLELSWYGLGPELRIHDVKIRDQVTGLLAFELRELRLALDTVDSLWSQQLVPARIVAMGTSLVVRRTKAGDIVVQGMHPEAPVVNPWLMVFTQAHVEMRDIQLQWQDEQRQIPDLVMSNIDLRLRNSVTRHQLEMDLQLPAENGAHVQLEADLRGSAATFSNALKGWRGAVYMAVEQAPLARWFGQVTPTGWRVDGIANSQLWATLDDGNLQQLRGSLQIEEPVIGRVETLAQPFMAKRVATQFDWQRNGVAADGAWVLSLAGLQIEQDDQDNRDITDASLTLIQQTRVNAIQTWQFAAEQLPIRPVAQLLALLPVTSAEQLARLQQAQPTGVLQNARIDASRRDDGTLAALMYRLQVQDFNSRAVERLPGVAAVSAEVSGDLTHGSLKLNSYAAAVDLPKLFRAPLQLEQLTGNIHWSRAEDRLHIEARDLRAVNADIRTSTRMVLDIPNDGSPPLLDLQTDFDNGLIESTHKYLPVGIMPPATVAWLDRALVSGHLQDGAILFRGRFGAFPFERANGRLEARAVVRDGVLDYREGWHRIEGLEAELGFVNRSMTIEAVAGKILGSDLSKVKANIENLAHARLDIDGTATGSLADILRFLRDSPLSAGRTAALDALHPSGEAQLQLALSIPLSKKIADKLSLDGRVQMADNGLDLPDWELSLQKIKGDLKFTQQGMNGRDLSAQLMGVPVQIDVADAPGEPMTRVSAKGKLPLLERLNKTQARSEYLSGRSDWLAAVYLPKSVAPDKKMRVELQSQLNGITIDVPEPFGKPAEANLPFTLSLEFKEPGLWPLQLSYGEHSAAMELQRDKDEIKIARGEVMLGAEQARMPDLEGVRIAGYLPQFDWDVWSEFIGSGDDGDLLRAVDVKVDLLHAFGRSFTGVEIDAQRDTGYWKMALGGPDIQGTLELPANKPLLLRCEHLHIPVATEGAVKPETKKRINPANIPALDVHVQQFQFRQLELGELTLKTQSLVNGLAVKELRVNADWMRLAVEGDWTRDEAIDEALDETLAKEAEASHFRVNVQGDKLGEMLTRLGYVGSVEGGKTQADIDAHWLGAPTDFSMAELTGDLDLEIGAGRLLNIEAGAGRLFGLFNLQGLRRRLALDFSDVFAKGFAFDRINGKFELREGDAYTDNLTIIGPAAHILVTGRTGLAKRDYDQLVTVSPQVQSSIPIAGAIAGGPVVGAALLLADQILGDQLKELTSFTRYQYTVTGSWDDVKFNLVSQDAARRLQEKTQKPVDPEPQAQPVPELE